MIFFKIIYVPELHDVARLSVWLSNPNGHFQRFEMLQSSDIHATNSD